MTAAARWDPGQYLRFSDHRLRPALELLARVPPDAPRVVVDLGCGTGAVTRMMAERWPAARIEGLDASPEMLRQAAAEPGPVRWIEGSIEDWRPSERPDLIFSNAALHWVEGHDVLLPRLLSSLAPGGCLAVQMPLSWDLPSHRLMRTTLADGGEDGRPLGTEALRRATDRRWVEDAAVYHDLLAPDARHLDVWTTEYLHVLEGEDPVLEWVRGTGLRPILAGLGDDERARFLAVYRRRLRAAYPPRPDGRTVFPFRRLFVVAGI
jgi:trans-aconitate 2-methyltransferase